MGNCDSLCYAQCNYISCLSCLRDCWYTECFNGCCCNEHVYYIKIKITTPLLSSYDIAYYFDCASREELVTYTGTVTVYANVKLFKDIVTVHIPLHGSTYYINEVRRIKADRVYRYLIHDEKSYLFLADDLIPLYYITHKMYTEDYYHTQIYYGPSEVVDSGSREAVDYGTQMNSNPWSGDIFGGDDIQFYNISITHNINEAYKELKGRYKKDIYKICRQLDDYLSFIPRVIVKIIISYLMIN